MASSTKVLAIEAFHSGACKRGRVNEGWQSIEHGLAVYDGCLTVLQQTLRVHAAECEATGPVVNHGVSGACCHNDCQAWLAFTLH